MKEGMMVRYCLAVDGGEPQDCPAQIVRVVDEDTVDLHVLDAGGHIVCGMPNAPRAASAAERIQPGHWWK